MGPINYVVYVVNSDKRKKITIILHLARAINMLKARGPGFLQSKV